MTGLPGGTDDAGRDPGARLRQAALSLIRATPLAATLHEIACGVGTGRVVTQLSAMTGLDERTVAEWLAASAGAGAADYEWQDPLPGQSPLWRRLWPPGDPG